MVPVIIMGPEGTHGCGGCDKYWQRAQREPIEVYGACDNYKTREVCGGCGNYKTREDCGGCDKYGQRAQREPIEVYGACDNYKT